ncbi:MAG: protein phosphatase 1 regulatory subunit 7 [Cyclobacteriaceae bacterium]|jgi:hypothetical protein
MNRIKIVHIIFLLASGLFVSCGSDNTDQLDDLYLDIPDAQFETKLINLGIDSDGKVNQQMLKEDAEEVRSLNLNSQNVNDEISDLTGIEGFISLKSLFAIGNTLTSIDLSANTVLDSLSLVGNAISSIDISNNTKLTWLDLKVNDITAITGLAEATHLKWLNLSFNLFEEFSIQNEFLENLLISDNLLKSFDASGAINLKSINIKTNELPSIDLSASTQLEVLVLSNNKIRTLNLDENSNLLYFYASSNLFTNLDVSKLGELIDLRVDRNPDLSCIRVEGGQEIPTVSISDYQELNTVCN